MKRTMLKVLAIAMAATLAFPSFVSAVPTPTAPGGAATIVNPVFNVTVPANLNFSIDPFEIRAGVGDSQIFSPVHVVNNRSNVPVVVTADFVVQAAGSATGTNPTVTIVDDLPATAQDIGETDKYATFAIEFATATEATFNLNTTVATNNVFDFDFTDAPSLVFESEPDDPDAIGGVAVGSLAAFAPAAWNLAANSRYVDAAKQVFFLLDAVDMDTYFNDPGTALRPNVDFDNPTDNVAGFRITGEVATYAPWVVADIRLFSRFTIGPVTPADFAAIDGGYGLATALNVAAHLEDPA